MPAVRIEEEAFGDERYDDLAVVAGLADADHARGKMAKLWRQCTLENTQILHRVTVERVLGTKGFEALVFARLGEQTEVDRIRIKGTQGRIEWLQKVRENGSKGGRPKGVRKQNHLVSAVETKNQPRQEQKQEQEQKLSSLDPALNSGPAEAARSEPPLDRIQVTPSDATVRENQQRVIRFVELVNAARARVAKKQGFVDDAPLTAVNVGSAASELLARLRASPKPDADMVKAVAVAEAAATKDPDAFRWLSWSIVRGNGWETKIHAAPPPSIQQRLRPAQLDPKPVVVSDADREEARLVAAEFRTKHKL